MKVYLKLLLAIFPCAAVQQMSIRAVQLSNDAVQLQAPQTLTEWDSLYGDHESRTTQAGTALDIQSFARILQAVEQSNHNTMRDHIINPASATENVEDSSKKLMHIQKAVLPVGSTVYCWGDVHGDIPSLIAALTHLKEQQVIDDQLHIIQPDTYIVSCGDFVDRGEHGVEVLFVLCQLKQRNPEHVFLVRGNHEEVQMNQHYGFYEECCRKFSVRGANYLLSQKLSPFYGSLPVALHVGVEREQGLPDYIQFCHGGLEFYDLRSLLAHSDKRAVELIKSLHRKTVCAHALGNCTTKETMMDASAAQAISDDIVPNASNIGFLWSDFNAGYRAIGHNYVPIDTAMTYYTKGRGFMFGQDLTEALTVAISGDAHIAAIIRAHQHNPSMPQLTDFKATPNRSIYKLFAQNSPKVAVITTVLTTQYASGRGFLKIELPSAQSSSWTLQGLWQSKGNGAPWKAHQKNTFANWHNPVS